jgi:hypothetical protein
MYRRWTQPTKYRIRWRDLSLAVMKLYVLNRSRLQLIKCVFRNRQLKYLLKTAFWDMTSCSLVDNPGDLLTRRQNLKSLPKRFFRKLRLDIIQVVGNKVVARDII